MKRSRLAKAFSYALTLLAGALATAWTARAALKWGAARAAGAGDRAQLDRKSPYGNIRTCRRAATNGIVAVRRQKFKEEPC